MREVQTRKKRRYKRENFVGTSDAATVAGVFCFKTMGRWDCWCSDVSSSSLRTGRGARKLAEAWHPTLSKHSEHGSLVNHCAVMVVCSVAACRELSHELSAQALFARICVVIGWASCCNWFLSWIRWEMDHVPCQATGSNQQQEVGGCSFSLLCSEKHTSR